MKFVMELISGFDTNQHSYYCILMLIIKDALVPLPHEMDLCTVIGVHFNLFTMLCVFLCMEVQGFNFKIASPDTEVW
jgi:hypothetical protein